MEETKRRLPEDIPEIFYKAQLIVGRDRFTHRDKYSDIVYYFDRNMNEIGYTVPWSNKVNEDTRNRQWDKSQFSKYHIIEVYWATGKGYYDN